MSTLLPPPIAAPPGHTLAYDGARWVAVRAGVGRLSKGEWLERVPIATHAAIEAAAIAATPLGAALRAWLRRFDARTEIDPAHPETIAGVQWLHTEGLLSAAERDALLAPAAPT